MSIRIAQQRFLDFDEFSSAAEGWDVDAAQLERGAFHADFCFAANGPVQLTRGLSGRRLLQRGAAPVGHRTFAIGLRRDTRGTWRGQTAPANALAVFPAGGEFETVLASGDGGFSVSVTDPHLERISAAYGFPPPSRLLAGADLLRADPVVLERLRGLLEFLVADPDRASRQMASVDHVRLLDVEVPRLLLTALGTARGVAEATIPTVRGDVLRRSEEYLRQHGSAPVRLLDLCEAVGTSERTLRRAFEDGYGVPPKTYLRAVRLSSARRDLLRGDPSALRVAEVATKWGFTHLGQFAVDYRAWFGERPSETLRRT